MNIEGRVKPNVERLKQLRREHGISQEGLADLCLAKTLRVSASSIKRAEAGKNLLYRTVRDLATFFAVDITELIDSSSYETATIVSESTHPSIFTTPRFKTYVIIDSLSSNNCQQVKDTLSQCDALTFLSFGQYVAVAQSTATNRRFSNHWITQLCSLLTSLLNTNIKIVVKTYPNGQTLQGLDHQGEFRALFHEQLLSSVLPSMFNAMQWGEIASDESSSLLFLQSLPGSALLAVKNEITFYRVDQSQTVLEAFAPQNLHTQQMHLFLEQTLASGMGEICCLTGCHGIGKTSTAKQFLNGLRGRGIRQIHVEENHLNKNLIKAKQSFLMSILELTHPELEAQGKAMLMDCDIPNNLRLVFVAWLGLPLSEAETNLLLNTPSHLLLNLELQLFRRLIRCKLSVGPFVLFLDDVHSYPDEIIKLVVALLEEIKTFPVFVILAFRKEGALAITPSWLRVAHHINFAGDGRQSSFALNHELKPREERDANMFHPLYKKEQVFCLAHGIDMSMSGFVRTVQAGLLELTPQEQQVLYLIAIFGGEASIEQLDYCLGEIVKGTETLVNKGLCIQCQCTVYMAHPTFMQAILPILSKDYRLQLHQLCESWFRHVKLIHRQVEHLSHFDRPSAASLLLDEAQTLGALHQYEQALNCIQHATQIDPQCQIASLQYSKGNWLYHLGQLKESIEAFQHADYLTTNVSLRVRYLTAKLRTWVLRYDPKRVENSFDLKELASFLEREPPEQAAICLLLGGYWFSQANFSEAAFYHKTALHFAELECEQGSLQQAYIGLGACSVAAGQMQTAEEYLRFSGWRNTCPEPNELDLLQWMLLESSHLYLLKLEEGLKRAERFLVHAEHENNMPNEAAGRLLMAWYLLEDKQWLKAEVHIRRGLQLAERLHSDVFLIFFIETQMRFEWGYTESVGKELIERAMTLVEQHQFESLIGPWLCGSAALYSSSQSEQLAFLRKGAYWLQQYACIGHNMLRFCHQAIQVSWINRDVKRLQHYTDLLENYIKDEPVPWASRYLKQADAYILMIEKDAYVNDVSEISKFDNKDGFLSEFSI